MPASHGAFCREASCFATVRLGGGGLERGDLERCTISRCEGEKGVMENGRWPTSQNLPTTPAGKVVQGLQEGIKQRRRPGRRQWLGTIG